MSYGEEQNCAVKGKTVKPEKSVHPKTTLSHVSDPWGNDTAVGLRWCRCVPSHPSPALLPPLFAPFLLSGSAAESEEILNQLLGPQREGGVTVTCTPYVTRANERGRRRLAPRRYRVLSPQSLGLCSYTWRVCRFGVGRVPVASVGLGTGEVVGWVGVGALNPPPHSLSPPLARGWWYFGARA